MVPAETFRAAVAADAEASVALRWARAAGDPMAGPLAAARSVVLADIGRARDALAVPEAAMSADGALEVSSDIESQTFALVVRGLVSSENWSGE